MATSKLQLLLELPINKLRNALGAAKKTVNQATGQMKQKLEEIKLPTLQTNQFRQKLKQTRDMVSNAVDSVKSKMQGLASGSNEAFNTMSERIPGLSGTLATLANPYTLIAAAIAAVVIGAIKLSKYLFEQSKEIAGHQQNIRATFSATGEELKKLTARTMATSKVFEKDFKEITVAANAFFKEFKEQGLTAEKSLTLLQKGLIVTNGLMDIDNVREYASQLRQAGLSAEQSISIISAQVSQGIFSDKGVDAIKEFGLRIKEMTPAAKDALKGLGLNVNSLLNDLNSGAKSTFQVMGDVTNAMQRASVTARQTAIADLFGGPGEDLGERALYNITQINTSLDEQIKKMGGLAAHQAERLRLEEAIALKQQEYAPALNEISQKLEILQLKGKLWFHETIAKGIEWLMQYKAEFKVIYSVVKSALGFLFNLWMVQWKISFSLFMTIVKTIIYSVNDIKLQWTYVFDTIKYGFQMGKLYAQNFGEYVIGIFGNIGRAWELVKKFEFTAAKEALFADITTGASKEIDRLKSEREAYKTDMINQQQKLKNDYLTGLKDTWTWNKKKATSTETDNPLQPEEPGGGGETQPLPPGGGLSPSQGVAAVAGQSQQVRNVSIHFDSYIKGDVLTQNTTIKNMDKDELMRWLGENMQKLIRSMELSY